jgi:hypothetical protein
MRRLTKDTGAPKEGGRLRRLGCRLPGTSSSTNERRPVRPSLKARDLPLRLTTGAYILHAGLEKRHAEESRASGIHGMATGAYPMLKRIPSDRFVRVLSASEIAIGSMLLAPVVPNWLAGAALTGFAGALVTMYGRTEAMHKPGSVWPTPNGTALSKDVWMLGIGLGLLIDGLTGRSGHGRG